MDDHGRSPLSAALAARIAAAIDAGGGWLPFDRYMQLALYAPGLGYYSRANDQLGADASGGSDFVTAPELSPLFGRTLARPIAQALRACDGAEVWEFGAGTGALAEQVIEGLADEGMALARYHIVDVSGALRRRQQDRLARHGDLVRWDDALPAQIDGVVLGNEVLDAMPVHLLHWDGSAWWERGVAAGEGGRLAWADRPTALRPPVSAEGAGHYVPGTTIELPVQAGAFTATLAERLRRGAAYFIDYGFPAHEFYLPQRTGGTLMCHRRHRADTDPLTDVGDKDITAHVDFTAIALAAQGAGCDVLGYTSMASFLLDAGLLERLHGAHPRVLAPVQTLLAEHQMGELFKVIAWARGCRDDFVTAPVGFGSGDRTHTL